MAIRALGHANSNIAEVESASLALRVVPVPGNLIGSYSASLAVTGVAGSPTHSNTISGVFRWQSERTWAAIRKITVGISESVTGTAGVYRVELTRVAGFQKLPVNGNNIQNNFAGKNVLRTTHPNASVFSAVQLDGITVIASNFMISAADGVTAGFSAAGTINHQDAMPLASLTYSRRATAGFPVINTQPLWDPVDPSALVLANLEGFILRTTTTAGMLTTTRLEATVQFDELSEPPF